MKKSDKNNYKFSDWYHGTYILLIYVRNQISFECHKSKIGQLRAEMSTFCVPCSWSNHGFQGKKICRIEYQDNDLKERSCPFFLNEIVIAACSV